jgi:hypothetical protein
MRRPRLLFALSADFGEYVTASIFCRHQPFDSHYALLPSLARYAPAGRPEIAAYAGIDDLVRMAADLRPDVVVLASGYLYPVNRIAQPEQLSGLVEQLKSTGAAVATTDPWLRIRSLKPGSRFTIYSVRKGGVDAELSAKMDELQDYLEEVFRDVPHLFAVPLTRGGNERRLPFFNPDFVQRDEGAVDRDGSDRHEWLFVLSREDFVFLDGFERDTFFRALGERIEELLSVERNHVRFIGPGGIGEYLRGRWPNHARVEFIAFCDFDAFESAIRRATIVAFWNVLSSSLLYCLYYRVPPIFFGKGHQARVCEGLFDHVVEHVYRGSAPHLLDLNAALLPRADALIERLDVRSWFDSIGRDYAQSQSPAEVMERVTQHHDRK